MVGCALHTKNFLTGAFNFRFTAEDLRFPVEFMLEFRTVLVTLWQPVWFFRPADREVRRQIDRKELDCAAG